MGEINLPSEERESIQAIDSNVLDRLIEQCLSDGRLDAIRTIRFDGCGPYISSRALEFKTAIAAFAKAKTARKRDETEARARRAGRDLSHAVCQMKERVQAEEKDGLVFQIDDQIIPPSRLGNELSVRVGFRWRDSIEAEWEYGSITFTHNVEIRDEYTRLQKRRPTAAKLEQDRQDTLYREWDQLMKQGLWSVRDFFRDGGCGTSIPKAFQVRTDTRTNSMNNSSAKFWL